LSVASRFCSHPLPSRVIRLFCSSFPLSRFLFYLVYFCSSVSVISVDPSALLPPFVGFPSCSRHPPELRRAKTFSCWVQIPNRQVTATTGSRWFYASPVFWLILVDAKCPSANLRVRSPCAVKLSVLGSEDCPLNFRRCAAGEEPATCKRVCGVVRHTVCFAASARRKWRGRQRT